MRAIREHRIAADRTFDREALEPVREVFNDEQAALVQTLARAGRAIPRASAENRAAIAGVLAVLAGRQLVRGVGRLAAAVEGSVRGTLADSIRQVGRFISFVTQRPTPFDEDAAVRALAQQREVAFRVARDKALAALSNDIAAVVRAEIKAALPTDKRIAEIVEAAGSAMDDQWWKVERVVRTETSVVYNDGQLAALKQAERFFPGLMQRWTEHVDDVTGAPLDPRVAADSMAMHGQVARVGGQFVCPAAPGVSARMAGKTWIHPPNRPNDRAVLTPWMRHWGIPGWIWQGARVDVS